MCEWDLRISCTDALLSRQLLPWHSVEFVNVALREFPEAIHAADQAVQEEQQDILHSTEETLSTITSRWEQLRQRFATNNTATSSRFKRVVTMAMTSVKKADGCVVLACGCCPGVH